MPLEQGSVADRPAPMNEHALRVVILCGSNLTHRNTCATLIDAGLQIEGICVADQNTGGLPLAHVRRAVRKEGIGATASQIAARMLHTAIDGRRERQARAEIFDQAAIDRTLEAWGGPWHHTSNYGDPATIEWLRSLAPDVLVVHSPYWVGQAVRAIPTTGLVIGGHPGLTPRYRGSHSALWAIAAGHPEDVGCTALLLDEGADTGVILHQERLEHEPGDTFVTLGWKGMVRIARLQADTVRALEAGDQVPTEPPEVPPHSYFSNPTVRAYLRYRRQARRLGMR